MWKTSAAMLRVVSLMMAAVPAVADECQSAQALVDKAIAHYAQVGKDKAFADFMDKSDKEWVDGDLYVIVAAEDGMFKVHPINPKLIDNPEIYGLRDVNGVAIVREMAKSGHDHPEGGWVKYTWTRPESRTLSPKQTWVKAYDHRLFMAGCYP